MFAHRRLILAAVLVAAVLVAMVSALPAVIPGLERDGVFKPRAYDPSQPWPTPPGSVDVQVAVDGLRLFGWFMPAAPQPARGAILYFHGNTGAIPDYLPTVERLRALGYDLMLWDYRGYGRSTGTPDDEAALYRDSEAMLMAFASRLGVPPSRLILYGYSLGSAAATEMARRQGCRALILQAPMATLRSHIEAHAPWLPGYPFGFLRNRLDNVGRIEAAGCPLLVIHGEADEAILVSQGRSVFAAAREPKQLVIVPNGRHVLDERTGWPHIAATAQFLDRHAR